MPSKAPAALTPTLTPSVYPLAGFKAFAVNIANIVDLVAILPFYIDVAIYLSAAARGSGSAQVLRVLRIIRLSRVARVLKFSKNLSGVIVLFRTLYKSLAAMGLILFFSIFMVRNTPLPQPLP